MFLESTKKMKFLFIFLVMSQFVSCTKNTVEFELNDKKIKHPNVVIVRIPTNNLKWDESYHPISKTRTTNQSDQMAVTVNHIFLGGLYTAKSIEDLSFDWLQYALDPLDVSYTFPRYFFDEIKRPSVSNMYRSLQKAIDSPEFTGKQSLAFEYDLREFTRYDELKLAFGANVNIAQIFKLNASVNYENIKSKSGLFARVVQKNFSMIMDYPYDGNVLLNNDDFSKISSKNPVYINSIIFGRMAIIAIESDYSYTELKTAVKASFSAKIVNGGLDISSKDKEILNNSTIRIFVSGGSGQDIAKIVMGFDEFKNFIINGGEFSKDVPGVPIFFTANYVNGNSVFRTKFVSE